MVVYSKGAMQLLDLDEKELDVSIKSFRIVISSHCSIIEIRQKVNFFFQFHFKNAKFFFKSDQFSGHF
jgi:hypothetical protein